MLHSENRLNLESDDTYDDISMITYEAQNEHTYDYNNPIDLNASRNRDPLLVELASTKAFKRLQHVRFLGSIDYMRVTSPNGAASNTRHNRYQHSLGVASLAILYADIHNLEEASRRLIYATALLHDIGHAPLSHSLEPVFQEEFGLNHHDATEDVIMGRVSLGHEIYQILLQYDVNPEQILNILSGQDDPFNGFFKGPINFDTIEAIQRTRQYYKPDAPDLSPMKVAKAAIERSSLKDLQIVDTFWKHKDEAYKLLIRSQEGVWADLLCQSIAKTCLRKLTRTDYFSTEAELFQKLPELRNAFKKIYSQQTIFSLLDETLHYKSRFFFVDSSANFYTRDDCNRYRQAKEDRVLNIPQVEEQIEFIEGELFDDNSLHSLKSIF